MTKPILIAGGSGVVGRPAAAWLRDHHPSTPILIGARNLRGAEDIAVVLGNAQARRIDLDQSNLGVADPDVAAVLMLAPDHGLHGLRLAQDHGVPYLSIGTGLPEVGAEMAMYANRPGAAPVVLASHWAGGAGSFLALDAARQFDRVRSIRIGIVLDENDPAGPAAVEDMERLSSTIAPALVFERGRRALLSGEALQGQVEAIDGRVLTAEAFSPFDIVGLHAVTGASDVRVDLVTDQSSSRRRGDGVAAEIIAEIEGVIGRATRRARSTLEFPHGQGSLTGLNAVLALSATMGLDDEAPASAGLYLPEDVREPHWFIDRLRHAGAIISTDSQ